MSTAPAPFEAFFLPVEGDKPGQRFCLFHPAQYDRVRGSVLYVHPFAEEMNKSRRMAALQSRALASAGFNVLQIDLLGCGDSSGDFGDATWQDWVEDVLRAIEWLRNRSDATLWLWGLRTGCLLAVDAAKRNGVAANFLLWAPPHSGRQLLQQFLRLKAVNSLADGSAKITMDSVRAELFEGRHVEIAGYQLASALASGLDQATLDAPTFPLNGKHLMWFEISARPEATMSPAGVKSFESWTQAGFASSHSQVIQGPAFWQTSEIEDAPLLVKASTNALTDASPE